MINLLNSAGGETLARGVQMLEERQLEKLAKVKGSGIDVGDLEHSLVMGTSSGAGFASRRSLKSSWRKS